MERIIRIHTDNMQPDNTDHILHVLTWKEHSATSSKPIPKWWPAGKKPVSRAVSCMKSVIQVQPAALQIAVQQHFNKLQELRIKELIEDHFESQGDFQTLAFDDSILLPESIAVWSAASASGQSERLSGDKIEQWFKSNIAAPLSVHLLQRFLVAGKSEAEIQSVLLPRAIGVFQQRFRELAAPGIRFDTSTCAQLAKALEVSQLPPSDTTANRLAAKLASLQQKQSDVLESIL